MKVTFHGITLELILGNIDNQWDVEAVVNASHIGFEPDGGVSTAIHNKAGAGLYEHCRMLVPLKPGRPVITPGFNLRNNYVIHCLALPYGTETANRVLKDCYFNVLKLADKHKMASIAFPAIGTGGLRFPYREGAFVGLSTVIDLAYTLKNVRTIRFVLFEEQTFDIFQNAWLKIIWEKRIPTENIAMK